MRSALHVGLVRASPGSLTQAVAASGGLGARADARAEAAALEFHSRASTSSPVAAAPIVPVSAPPEATVAAAPEATVAAAPEATVAASVAAAAAASTPGSTAVASIVCSESAALASKLLASLLLLPPLPTRRALDALLPMLTP
eukprot:4739767-Pleurochrysis_carterae.AAC.1